MFFFLLQAEQQAALASDFNEKLILTLVDKGLLALLILIAGFWFNRLLEKFKSQQATLLETFKSQRSLENELAKIRDSKRIEALEKQLSQFYWPIYMRLHLAHTAWQRISNTEGGKEELRETVMREIEKNLVLPNHDAVVRILRENIYLAENDGKLFKAMLEYTRYVEVLRALRAGGQFEMRPKDLGAPWPAEFPNLIAKWAYKIQAQYDALVASSSTESSRATEPDQLQLRNAIEHGLGEPA